MIKRSKWNIYLSRKRQKNGEFLEDVSNDCVQKEESQERQRLVLIGQFLRMQ